MQRSAKKMKTNKWPLLVIQGIIILYMMFDAVGLFVDKVLPKSRQTIEGMDLSFLKGWFIFMVAVGILGYLVLWRGIGKLAVEKTFVYLSLLFGMAYLLVMPVYSAPDENTHIPTVYYYSNQLLGKEAVDEDGNVMWRKHDDEVLNHARDKYPTARTYAVIYHHFWDKSTEDTMVSSRVNELQPLHVNFLGYIPQILGISIARLLHFGPVGMFFLGKLFILLCYTALVYFAIKIIPVGKEMLSVIALLPVSLAQATSYSYDGMVTAVSFLFIAVVLRVVYEDREIKNSELLILAVAMVFMSAVKVVYFVLGFILFAIPAERFSKPKKKWLVIGALLLIGIISILCSRFSQVVELTVAPTAGYMDKQTYTIGALLNEPIRIVYIVYATLRNGVSGYLSTLLGSGMGWSYISIPRILQFSLVVVMVLASLQRQEEAAPLSGGKKSWFVLAAVLCFAAIEGAMLLAYTPVGVNYIKGVQGRYFLPLLPLVLILFKTDAIVVKKEIKAYINMAVYVIQYFSLLYIGTFILESMKGLG